MILKSKCFGDLEVDENEIIEFSHGLPGFPEDKRFIIISDADTPESVYCWLQSVDDSNLSLVLIKSFAVLPEYEPLVNMEELEDLGDFDQPDLAVFNVAVIAEKIDQSTINLKAPIVINEMAKKGKQVIVNNDEYDIRHNLLECIKNEGRVQ